MCVHLSSSAYIVTSDIQNTLEKKKKKTLFSFFAVEYVKRAPVPGRNSSRIEWLMSQNKF